MRVQRRRKLSLHVTKGESPYLPLAYEHTPSLKKKKSDTTIETRLLSSAQRLDADAFVCKRSDLCSREGLTRTEYRCCRRLDTRH